MSVHLSVSQQSEKVIGFFSVLDKRSNRMLPVHVFPSPFRLYPGLQRHLCANSVFTQICSQGPNPPLLEHSLLSIGKTNNSTFLL